MLFENTRKEIIKDLTNMTESTFIKKYMNVDINNISNEIIIDNFCGFMIPIDTFFKELKLDVQLNLLYYNEKLYNGEDQYQDAANFLLDYMEFNESDNYLIQKNKGLTINTYNYESWLNEILQYTIVYDGINSKYYIALEVHQGGDARTNYSHVFFFEYIGDIDYIFDMQESCYIYIDGCNLSINVIQEEAYFYDYKTGETTYFNALELVEIIPILLKNNIKVTGVTFEY